MFAKLKKFVPVSMRQTIRHFFHALRVYKKHNIPSYLLKIPEAIIGRYITFHTRPKYARDVFVDAEITSRDYSEYAIVMHGVVRTESNFTVETLLLYKKYFPNASIILSTWEGEDQRSIDWARKAGIEVLCNKKPDERGPTNEGRTFHINLQIVSSQRGLYRAAEMNKKYVLETRSDQRMYNQELLTLLSNLVSSFPIHAPGIRQRGRLVGIGSNNSKSRPYLFPDHVIFGYTEDVLSYYGINLAPKNTTFSFLDSAFPFVAEVYLFTEFLKNIGYHIEGTYEDYLRAMAKHCIVVDPWTLDWYFVKHAHFRERKGRNYKGEKGDHTTIGFSEWFNLYNLYNST